MPFMVTFGGQVPKPDKTVATTRVQYQEDRLGTLLDNIVNVADRRITAQSDGIAEITMPLVRVGQQKVRANARLLRAMEAAVAAAAGSGIPVSKLRICQLADQLGYDLEGTPCDKTPGEEPPNDVPPQSVVSVVYDPAFPVPVPVPSPVPLPSPYPTYTYDPAYPSTPGEQLPRPPFTPGLPVITPPSRSIPTFPVRPVTPPARPVPITPSPTTPTTPPARPPSVPVPPAVPLPPPNGPSFPVPPTWPVAPPTSPPTSPPSPPAPGQCPTQTRPAPADQSCIVVPTDQLGTLCGQQSLSECKGVTPVVIVPWEPTPSGVPAPTSECGRRLISDVEGRRYDMRPLLLALASGKTAADVVPELRLL